MPELPDLTVYLEALGRRVMGQVLEKVRLQDMFVFLDSGSKCDIYDGWPTIN
jgi:hypothetical protein